MTTDWISKNMPPNAPSNNKNKRMRTLAVVGVSLLVITVVVAAVVVGLYLFEKNLAISQVKDELNKAVSTMASKHDETGAYPASITDIIASSNDRVVLKGSSSFDGTTYCISGTSSSDKSAVFHVDSTKTSQGPQSGTCETRSDLPVPSAPGGLSVAFANSNEVNVTWSAALYADSYTMQCSTDRNFSNPIIANATDNAGMCEKLESKTMYYCRVKAINAVGNSAWSETLEVSTL